ncbi:MAG: hypothetical protein H2172_05425 [Opitutus sp.]|nr:hypothetical protein [Opitutus sp.]MCS6298635.1 hypothetical protein [Opitutus sp.]
MLGPAGLDFGYAKLVVLTNAPIIDYSSLFGVPASPVAGVGFLSCRDLNSPEQRDNHYWCASDISLTRAGSCAARLLLIGNQAHRTSNQVAKHQTTEFLTANDVKIR